MKRMFGLEGFPYSDTEILQRIKEARHKDIETVEFSHQGKKVRINLNQISKDGIMRGYQDYYNSDW